ncbi:MAG: HDOD domain-containing protein [Betaproteobacteria bacterium]|nr:HDOD domain-containing protein [Betaproteobacteria bacterium]
MSTTTAALDFLWMRMQHRPDFPAFSASVRQVLNLIDAENETLSTLASGILQDGALTQKLLRLVNSSYYRHRWGGNVTTVSRAVALVGIRGVRNLVLSLIVIESMRDSVDAGPLYEELLRGIAAGTLAHELASHNDEAEEAFVSGLMQNLGRMLAQFYFPEEARQIKMQCLALEPAQRPQPKQQDDIARKVLGISLPELGTGVARKWDLPDTIVFSMRRCPEGSAPAKAREPAELHRALGSAANELVEHMHTLSPQDWELAVKTLAQRFDKSLGLSVDDYLQAVGLTRSRMQDLVDALGIPVARDAPAAAWLLAGASADSASARRALPQQARMPVGTTAVGVHPDYKPGDTTEVLEAGMAEIITSLVEDKLKLNQIVRIAIETLYRAFGFQRIVFCLRDPRKDRLLGKFALGLDAEYLPARFDIGLLKPVPGHADLFTRVCSEGLDTLVADATEPALARQLPPWYTNSINAPNFLLLPLISKSLTIGLIYADREKPGLIDISDRNFSQLDALRKQLILAFRQAASH